MYAGSQFSVALHILCTLAHRAQRVSSIELSRGIKTNPVVIRKIIAQLSRDKIIDSQVGKNGGCKLARPANKISLLEIFESIEDGQLFNIHDYPADKNCKVSKSIKSALKHVFLDTECAVKKNLKSKNLTDVLNRMNIHLS